MDGWMDGWMDGGMDGWRDGWIPRRSDPSKFPDRNCRLLPFLFLPRYLLEHPTEAVHSATMIEHPFIAIAAMGNISKKDWILSSWHNNVEAAFGEWWRSSQGKKKTRILVAPSAPFLELPIAFTCLGLCHHSLPWPYRLTYISSWAITVILIQSPLIPSLYGPVIDSAFSPSPRRLSPPL